MTFNELKRNVRDLFGYRVTVKRAYPLDSYDRSVQLKSADGEDLGVFDSPEQAWEELLVLQAARLI